MWGMFSLGVLLGTLIVLLPGGIQFYCLGFSVPVSVALAPVVSIAEYVVLGVAFGLAGIPIGWCHLLGGAMALSLMSTVLLRQRPVLCETGVEPCPGLLVLFLLIGALACLALYVGTLGSPEAFAQQFDNASHLNRIQTFISTSRFSTVQASTAASAPISPMSDFAFYPSGWHILAAMVSEAIGCSPAMSENVVNAVFLAVVWPSSIALLAESLFPANRWAAASMGLLAFASPAFPWGFIASGPLYANFAGYALLPSGIVLCKRLLRREGQRLHRGILLAFLLSLASLVSLQPNAIFVLLVAAVPHALVRLRNYCLHRGLSGNAACFVCLLALLAFCACWVAGIFLPGLSAVAANCWRPYAPGDYFTALRDCLLMGFRNAPAQLPLAVLTVLGVICSIRSKVLRPLLVPLTFFALAYVCNACMWFDDFIPRVLFGYWYNDIDRAAACVTLFALPFAALGAEMLLGMLGKKLSSRLSAAFVLLLMLSSYIPSFDASLVGHVETALGAREERLREIYSSDLCLTDDEVAFLKLCQEEIGNAEVINNPFDGSAFGYGVAGLNVRYRSFWPTRLEESERADWDVTRWLYQVGEYASVRKSVDEIGDEYVLQLDSDRSAAPTYYKFTYAPVVWQGVTRINDDTPGFETVLARADMRLYRILPVE